MVHNDLVIFDWTSDIIQSRWHDANIREQFLTPLPPVVLLQCKTIFTASFTIQHTILKNYNFYVQNGQVNSDGEFCVELTTWPMSMSCLGMCLRHRKRHMTWSGGSTRSIDSRTCYKQARRRASGTARSTRNTSTSNRNISCQVGHR